MSRFLRFFVFLFTLFFVGNALAAGYVCQSSAKKYTSCKSGYYMTASSTSTTCNTTAVAGNACRPCSAMGSGYTCAGGTACPVKSSVTCSPGYYLPANATSCSACGGNSYYCPGGTFTPSSSSQGRSVVWAGYYTTGGTSTTRTGQEACIGRNYYCSGGVKKPVSPGHYTTGITEITITACESQGKLCSKQVPCTGNTYCLSGVQHSCPTNYTISGTAASDHDAKSDCKITCAAGTRVVTADASCVTPQGSWYTSAHTVSAGSTSGTNVESCTTSYSTPNSRQPGDHDASTDCVTYCDGGEYVAETFQACETVPAGYFKEAHTVRQGSISSLERCNFDWGGSINYDQSDAGSSSEEDCYAIIPGGFYAADDDWDLEACAAGTYSTEHRLYYMDLVITGSDPNGCKTCPNNTYSNSGAESCTACNTTNGYGNSGPSASNHAGVTSCKVSCAAGTRVASANAKCTTPSGNWYVGAHTVSQGNTSSVNSCLTNYTISGTAATNHDAANDCKISCAAGTRIASANATSCTTPSGNWYIGAHTVSQGSTSSISSCPTSYTISGTTAANHDAKSDCKISCAAGTRVASADAACTTPTGSWYTGSHTVSAGSTSGTNVKSCVSGYATANTTTKTDHDASTDCKISCAAGTRVASTNATCTTPSGNWYVGAHTVSQGSTSSVSSCLTNYTISGTAATNHDAANDCKITCSGGTYLASANATSCTSVGTGYWAASKTVSQGSTSSRTQCPAGYRDGSAASAQNQCKMNVPATKYVKAANDASPSACGTGTYKAAHTVNYGSTSTCSGCPSGYDDGAAASAQSGCKMSVAGGKYVATANSSTQTSCPNWKYKEAHTVTYGSTSSCTSCPALTSGWSKKDSTGTGWSSYTSCVQVSGTPANCSSGNLKQTATSSTTWGSSSINTALRANSKYYVNGLSCSACPAGSYCTGGTAAATKCAVGSYSTGTASACTVCGAGKTTASTGTTSSSSCTSCASITGLASWATPSWSANTVSNLCTVGTCSANYYKSGNTCPTCSSGTNSKYTKSAAGATSVNSCYLTTTAGNYVATAKAGQVTCAAGGWCPGGSNIYYGTGTTTGGRTACSTLGTGYTNTSTGQSANTSCYLPVAAGSVRVGTSGTTLDTCDAGTYKAAHNAYYGTTYSCSVCGNNQYSNAGAGSCTACNTTNGYTNSGTSASSHAGVASCKTACDGGEYVASANAACTSVGTGYWAASKTVSQGSTSSRTQCPAGYRDGSAASAQNQCKMNVPAAKYVKTANDATSTACGTGTYKAAHTVNYGSTSTCSGCPSGYDDGAAASAQSGCKITCSGGYRVTTANGACSAITSGNVYIGSHSVSYGSTSPAATSCPTSYTISGTTAADHDAKSDCKISCAAGTRVVSADAACTTPTGSWYTGAHTVSAGSTSGTNVKSCVSGYATANTTTKTDHDASTDCKISCAAGTRVASANATCTTPSGNWYVGAHTVSQGSTSRVNSCLTNYTISGTAATNHDAANDCKITCSGGSYIATANNTSCSAVGAGYWAAASTVSQGSAGVRNACDAGLTTIGSGAGADEAADCGRVLNFNGEKIYLRSESKTTPSLNVSINGTTYYGNMSTATKGSLRIKSGTTTYSVYDDSM